MSYSSTKSVRTLKKALSVTLAITTIVLVSGIFSITPLLAAVTINEGDIIRGPDGIKVYIVNEHSFKRHIFNPAVFNMYGHLSWANIKEVDQATLDSYQTSDLYKAAGHEEIYSLEESGSGAIKHWITTWADFTGLGYVMNQVFIINDTEIAYTGYTTGSDLVYTALPVSGGLEVSLASDTTASGTIVADTTAADGAQGLASVLKLKLVGGAADVKITSIKIHRQGISADGDISNMYLYNGDTYLADSPVVASTYYTFTNSAGILTVAKGTTVYLTVKIDLTNGTLSGKTIQIGVVAASDITSDASSVSGTFPINGNSMSTATVADLGKLTLAHVSDPGATIDAGLTAQEIWKFSLTAADQKIKVGMIKLTVIGSLNVGDITNLYLHDGVSQVGSTVAGLAGDKTVTFSFATPYEISSGQIKNISLRGDIVSGSSRNFYFEVAGARDIVATDANYGVSLKLNKLDTYTIIKAANTTVINAGTLIITKRSDSPQGNVAKDNLGVTLASYDVKAAGEAVKVTNLIIRTTVGGALDAHNVDNGKILLDGVQIGTTKDLDSDATPDANTTDDDAGTDDDTTYTFGSSFLLNAGQTRVLTIVGDIKKGDGTAMAANDTILITLEVGADNAQRMSSGTTFNTAEVGANVLTVAAGALTAAKNPAVGAITVVKGATNAVIGSFLVTAGAAEGMNVTSIGIVDQVDGAETFGDAFNNLKLYNGTTQLGSTITSPTATGNEITQTFNLSSALSIAAGQSVQIDIKADVLSGATWTADEIDVDTITGTGVLTSQSVTDATNRVLQTLTVLGAGTITVSVDSSTPIATQMVMGGLGQTLAIWKFQANAIENIDVSQIIVTDVSADNSGGNINNLKLYVDGVQVGSTIPALSSATTGTATFSASPKLFTISAGGYKLVSLKSDITTYVSGAVSNKNVQIKVDVPATITGATANTIIARGASGNYALTPGAAAFTANAEYVYRTTLTPSIAVSGSATGRVRATSDIIGKLTLSGASSADAQLRQTITNAADATTLFFLAPVAGVSVVATDATNQIDGTSISFTPDTGASLTKAGYAPATALDLSGTSRVSFWVSSTSAETAADVKFSVSEADATLTTLSGTTIDLPALTAGAAKWVFVDLPWANTTAQRDAVLSYGLTSAAMTANGILRIDQIRFYNDSLVINVGGATAAQTNGVAFSLKDSGGTVRGVGYIANTAASAPTAVKILIDITQNFGVSAQTYDIVTNTNTLLVVDTTAVETLSITTNLGTASAAGDFRWYDQAISAITPINWLSGTSPISVSLGY